MSVDYKGEMRNLVESLQKIYETIPPKMTNIDIYGGTMSLVYRTLNAPGEQENEIGSAGIDVCGDHIFYIDFEKMFDIGRRVRVATDQGKHNVAEKLRGLKDKMGFLLADVSGHSISDAAVAAMLYSSFMAAAPYELEKRGKITAGFFENQNMTFHSVLKPNKSIATTYAEVLEDGTVNFVLAGNPPPVVFSREFNRLVDIGAEGFYSYPNIGILPSRAHMDRKLAKSSPMPSKDRYRPNQVKLMNAGDTMLFITDGVTEHVRQRVQTGPEGKIDLTENFFPESLEASIRNSAGGNSAKIYRRVMEDVLTFNPEIADDVSCVVIRRKK